jgi:hypothetical protein
LILQDEQFAGSGPPQQRVPVPGGLAAWMAAISPKNAAFFRACTVNIYRLSIIMGQAAMSAVTGAESAIVEVLFF